MRIRPAFVAAAAVVVFACLLAGGALAATFSDPVGDTFVAPSGADASSVTPVDITGLEVTNTAAGLVTFRITVTAQTLPRLSSLDVVLDLDKNVATGDEGADASLGLLVLPDGTTAFSFDRWNGTELVDVTTTTTAAASFTAGVLTITVPRSELLDTRGFDFVGIGLAFTTDLSVVVLDVAPDTEQPFSYDLVGLPPPPPPKLSASKPVGAPGRPTAGKAFSVSSLVKRQDTGATLTSGTVACVVRVGTARIRAVGRFSGGRARCALTVPRTAKGKTLRGTMTIRSAGGRVAASFSFRVG